jgi:hypothetical protein
LNTSRVMSEVHGIGGPKGRKGIGDARKDDRKSNVVGGPGNLCQARGRRGRQQPGRTRAAGRANIFASDRDA